MKIPFFCFLTCLDTSVNLVRDKKGTFVSQVHAVALTCLTLNEPGRAVPMLAIFRWHRLLPSRENVAFFHAMFHVKHCSRNCPVSGTPFPAGRMQALDQEV